MVARSELNSAPNSAAGSGSSVGAQGIVLASEELITHANIDDEQSPCAADLVDDHPDHPTLNSPQPRSRGRANRMRRALLKPFVMLATSQYFIVAVLAGLTAVTLASAMAKTVNSSLEPIIAALKRF